MEHSGKKLFIGICGLLAVSALSGCGAGERLADVGKTPDMTPIENPATSSENTVVSMPMPAPKLSNPQKNSLWGGERQTFFKDQRASDVGDILTVMIDIKDEAALDNETERKRTSGEDASLGALLGYETALNRLLPQDVVNTDLIESDSNSNYKGTGTVEREETVKMKLAATITQVLPNGNMVIQGKQEVRVNFEKRILQLAGVIRPEDVSVENTISYDQIAEARISYGGKGQMTDMQQPRYGQQVYDIIFPF